MATNNSGKQYWRSLDQLNDTPEFREWLHREFPAGASELDAEGPSRRKMLTLMAASFGLAGLTACRRPVEHVLPMSKGIEIDDYIHGKPLFYATVMPFAGTASGLLVEVNDGRPTKIEGNPEHPESLGAANAFQQASVLGLYDPDRSNQVRQGASESTWAKFGDFAKSHFAQRGQGEKLRLLSERTNSPSLDAVRAAFMAKFPKAKWVEYEPIAHDAAVEGAVLAFGQPVRPVYRLDKADVVLSLDNDFLGLDSPTVAPTKGYAKRRRVHDEHAEMNRLYVVESQHSITGGMADHRLRMRSGDILKFAADLAAQLGAGGATLNILNNDSTPRGKWIAALAKDLNRVKGKGLVMAGPRQPAAVHAIVYSINQTLGNAGETVSYVSAGASFMPQLASLKELAGEMAAGQVDTLVILGGNPVFTAPADLEFEANLKKVATSIHLGIEVDETAVASTWHIPMAHYLESWGDARTVEGITSIQQPMIDPLFGGKTSAELLAALCGYKDQKAYDIVRNYWLGQLAGADKELQWRKALHNGLFPASAAAPPKLAADGKKALASPPPASASSGFEVVFVPSSSAYDGRYANNGWLQEMADPMTKLTWDNAALISPASARQLGVSDGEMISIERGGRKLEIVVVIQPGHADQSITIPLGYGRTKVGHVGSELGFNAYKIRTTDAFGFGGGFNVSKAAGSHLLARTVDHHAINADMKPGVDTRIHSLVKEATVDEFKKNPKFVNEGVEEKPSVQLYPAFDYSRGNQWGLTIDLNSCIGCNACVVACQAENNIPIVGKEQVMKGREMHWIRLDRYYTGPEEDPQVSTQPVTCMQCETAPCENVCPVAATSHSPEGLNDMAYNRCVGTRYCSNNCPYKVRRFNFFNYHKETPETTKMVFNPDVTVRMRGVMEKCTYCTQRIQEVKIQVKVEGRREIKDGEIVPACAQTCPADAIVFGNINDKNSRVAKLKAQERNYSMLDAELNTKPRTSYLAKLRNPNPELESHV